MAQLHVVEGFEGPGEEKAALALKTYLPDTWHVVANRKLPRNSEDVDFLVVGQNRVFVLEEKHWGPKLIMSDLKWRVVKKTGHSDSRTNPVSSAFSKARKVAGWIRSELESNSIFARGRFVDGHVLLTYENLQFESDFSSRKSEIEAAYSISTSEVVCEKLMDLDEKSDFEMSLEARSFIVNLFLGLSASSKLEVSFDNFRVLEEVPSQNGIRTFSAEKTLNDQLVLIRCAESISADENAETLLHRELEVAKKLEAVDTCWPIDSAVDEPNFNLHGLVYRRPLRTNSIAELIESVEYGHVNISEEDELVEVAISIFESLAKTHEAGVVHKALCPERIWTSVREGSFFSDFYMARKHGEQSVYFAEDDETSLPHRPPESEIDLTVGNAKSDVYATASSLLALINKIDSDESKYASLRETLQQGVQANGVDRPSAREMQEKLSQLNKLPELKSLEKPEKGSNWQVERRSGDAFQQFVLQRRLGEGGSGETWLAKKENDQALYALKFVREDRQDAIDGEQQGARVVGKNIVVPFMQLNENVDGNRSLALVSNYVEGDTLSQWGLSRRNVPEGMLDDLRKIAQDVAESLELVHKNGYVHCDVSGSNVIWTGKDAKLIDFGLARRVGAKLLGTPSFGLPGFMKDSTTLLATPAQDFYSLAFSLFDAAVGRAPMVSNDGQRRIVKLSEIEKSNFDPGTISFLNGLLKVIEQEDPASMGNSQSFMKIIESVQPKKGKPEIVDGQVKIVNPIVDEVRKLYKDSKLGASGQLGIETAFAKETYVETPLDTELLPLVLEGGPKVFLLTGNAGDGKTSFIQMAKERIIEEGGKVFHEDRSGWKIDLNELSFKSIYDASESQNGLSSEDVLREGFDEALDGTTLLVAINDGKLRAFRDKFEELFSSDGLIVTIVDLKDRPLETLDKDGLTGSLIDKITDENYWKGCLPCSSRPNCPIYENQNELSSSSKHGVQELVLTSHLRRNKRATFRDVRSALAWIITGDLGCDDVHRMTDENRNLIAEPSRLLFDLAFSDEAGDHLIQEWSSLDPARGELSDLQEEINSGKYAQINLFPRTILQSESRKRFFKFRNSSSRTRSTRLFEHLESYVQALKNGVDEDLKRKLLLGLSRISASPVSETIGLAVGSSSGSNGWSFMRIFEDSNFELVTNGSDESKAIFGSMPDLLTIRYSKGTGEERNKALNIDLDSFELIMRASEGEVFTDLESRTGLFEIRHFINSFSREAAQEAELLGPLSNRFKIRSVEGKIVKEG